KGDSLPNEGWSGSIVGSTPVLQHNKAWLLSAPRGDTKESAHVLLTHPVGPIYLAVQANFAGHSLCPLGEFGWRQDVRWFIAQIASEVGGLGEYLAPEHGRV